MTYVDTGKNTQTIGHCRVCKFQWVVTADVKGKTGSHSKPYDGKRCPFCNRNSVYYTKESNR